MVEIGDVVGRVLVAVRNFGSNDSEILDGVIFFLNQSSLALGDLVNSIILREEINAHPEVIVDLQEMRSYVDRIVLDMHKAFHGPGRKKKPLNILMVSSNIVIE